MKGEEILTVVRKSVDAIAKAGVPHNGLFPGILNRKQLTQPLEMPEEIPGQRMGDRAFAGPNLTHDEALLKTMCAIGHGEQADKYLGTSATECTNTPSGLFPWGEHSFWEFARKMPGDGILPRGAAGYDYYDSQMGPGFLLHGLARTALLAQDKDACVLGADYTAR